MKDIVKKIVFSIAFCCCFSVVNAQIAIDNTTYSTTQLVDGVLVPSGSGTVISNVVFRGVYNNSGRYQVGYFSTATTTLAQMGFTNGVVLTSGNTSNIPLALGVDPRSVAQMSLGYTSCTPGEVRQGGGCPAGINDLDILAGAQNYFNASVLEFDFVPVENSVQFRYIFGSEEYSDDSGFINYQCSSYNDKFGFLISGPGIAGGQGYTNDARNIARLGNGSEVSINSVNNGVVGSSGGAPNAANCTFANGDWVQNTPTPEYLGTIDGTQLNGNTRILTATQTGLIPGQTYHIKLIVTDVNDGAYDSVVYIEAGSFTTEFSCNAGPDQTLCALTSATLAASSPATGTWSVISGSGTFVSNTDPNTIVNGLSVGSNVFRWTASDLSCFADVTISVTAQPVQPTPVNCWDNFVFNTTTCAWDNTGSQPVQPTPVNCWDNFVFNTTTCAWDNTGSQPVQPTPVNCWDNFVFNTTTCAWDNTGSQPVQPTPVNCWDNFVFNTTTCAWDNTGSQPVQPTPVNCWDNFAFNTTTCAWDNTGSQPVQPTPVNCWDNFAFNTTTCAWDNTGSQPVQPTPVNCWDNFVFNTTTCVWDNTGSQPLQPTPVNCWDNFVFNTTTCAWDNTGSQPVQPTPVNCWDNFVFNTTTCAWDNTGSQPVQPTPVNCWDNFVFNTTTCAWDNTGSQPVQPTPVNCWDNFVFNTTTCAWDNTGSQPVQPTPVNCWDNFVFNTTTCAWDNTGSQPVQPTPVNCWDNFVFNATICTWENTGTESFISTISGCNGVSFEITASIDSGIATYEWYDGSSNLLGTTATISVTSSATYEVRATVNSCTIIEFITIDNAFCSIPKGLSPNGDGLNDTWDLSNLNVSEVKIFNRYGLEVYQQNNYTNQWDGRDMKGNELPTATYYYVITFESGKQKTGWVYLQRVK
jgi:gliding motility-associated-like protein